MPWDKDFELAVRMEEKSKLNTTEFKSDLQRYGYQASPDWINLQDFYPPNPWWYSYMSHLPIFFIWLDPNNDHIRFEIEFIEHCQNYTQCDMQKNKKKKKNIHIEKHIFPIQQYNGVNIPYDPYYLLDKLYGSKWNDTIIYDRLYKKIYCFPQAMSYFKNVLFVAAVVCAYVFVFYYYCITVCRRRNRLYDGNLTTSRHNF